MDEEGPGRRAAYEAAMQRLPVVTRVLFLLHRVDGLSYREIACRLSIDCAAVEACIAEALGMMMAILDGDTPRRWRGDVIVPVEAVLRQRHRAYCEGALRALGIVAPLLWRDDMDDEQVVVRAMVHAMPAPVLETFLLHQVNGMHYTLIARNMGTFQWIVRRRMMRAIRHVAKGPQGFEQWLCGLSLSNLEGNALTMCFLNDGRRRWPHNRKCPFPGTRSVPRPSCCLSKKWGW
jgi:DNA-directed RNA polymerase specialized sigma24 family protein